MPLLASAIATPEVASNVNVSKIFWNFRNPPPLVCISNIIQQRIHATSHNLSSLGVLPSSLPQPTQRGRHICVFPCMTGMLMKLNPPPWGFRVMRAYYKAASDKAHVSRLNLTAHRPTGLGSTMLIAAIHTLHSWFYSNSFLPEVVRSRLAPFVQLFFRA